MGNSPSSSLPSSPKQQEPASLLHDGSIRPPARRRASPDLDRSVNFDGNNVLKTRLRRPKKVDVLFLNDGAWPACCWNLGLTYEDFAARVSNRYAKVVKSSSVRVHFPVYTLYYAVVTYQSPRKGQGFTKDELLRNVYETATIAIAAYLRERDPKTPVTYKRVYDVLKKQRICKLIISKNNPPGYDVFVA